MRPGYDKASCSDSKGRGCAEEETRHVHRRKPNKRSFCLTSVSQDRCGIADREDGPRGDTCCGVMAKLNGEQKSAAELAIPTN